MLRIGGLFLGWGWFCRGCSIGIVTCRSSSKYCYCSINGIANFGIHLYPRTLNSLFYLIVVILTIYSVYYLLWYVLKIPTLYFDSTMTFLTHTLPLLLFKTPLSSSIICSYNHLTNQIQFNVDVEIDN